jgi:hypothetical protein
VCQQYSFSCFIAELACFLGEMYFNPSGPSSVHHLPREDGVAYAPQESWVINETIRVRSS